MGAWPGLSSLLALLLLPDKGRSEGVKLCHDEKHSIVGKGMRGKKMTEEWDKESDR